MTRLIQLEGDFLVDLYENHEYHEKDCEYLDRILNFFILGNNLDYHVKVNIVALLIFCWIAGTVKNKSLKFEYLF